MSREALPSWPGPESSRCPCMLPSCLRARATRIQCPASSRLFAPADSPLGLGSAGTTILREQLCGHMLLLSVRALTWSQRSFGTWATLAHALAPDPLTPARMETTPRAQAPFRFGKMRNEFATCHRLATSGLRGCLGRRAPRALAPQTQLPRRFGCSSSSWRGGA